MLLDLINFGKIKRALLYFAVILVVMALQTLLFARLRILGAAPMFVPAVVTAVALFEGGVWGAAFGLVTGILCALRYSGTVVLFPILFSAIGFFSGTLAQYVMNRRFFSYFALSVAAFVLTAFCQMFRPLFFLDADPLAVLRVGLFQVLWSLPFPFLIYFPVKNIGRRR
jgi:hypothetical protein